MILIRQIKIPINSNQLKEKVSERLLINASFINKIIINKRSIDARYKPKLYYIYEVLVSVYDEDKVLSKIKDKDIMKAPPIDYKYQVSGNKKIENKIIIIGSGPAGLFCAYLLSLNGYKTTIIERGDKVENRVKDVNCFFNGGKLNLESNVQFGEGGAGTFSDGKLNTLVKDKNNRIKFILKTFVECGANEDIMYDNKPHIGTDILRDVIINLRKKIIANGGEFIYNTKLIDINISDKVNSIKLSNGKVVKTNLLVLAIGNSARDTFRMLSRKNIEMKSKPFAIGVRIQQSQKLINKSQYGGDILTASYKLTYKSSNNRGVYTFCMCPGGYVVNASSEHEKLVINGMSNYKRESANANSAIVVTVNDKDYGKNPLDGLKFQEKIENIAYNCCKGKIPVQLYEDFKRGQKSLNFKDVKPVMKGDYEFYDINRILPNYITDALKEGIDYFSRKINGFSKSAIISAVETRTSSPIRIVRNFDMEAIEGLYPIGEGAGYAGGITSSALDGLKCAEKIMLKYKKNN